MAEAAALVEELYAPDFLDINFGCPVKKVVNRNGGSGCLRDLDLVQAIIRAVKAAIAIPVTVKIRSGWSEETRNPVEIALRCQDAGAEVLTLHARTRTQMYSGTANWDEIAAMVQALDIPVIGNGDVWTGEDAAPDARPHRLRRHHDRPRLARRTLDLPAGARGARRAAGPGGPGRVRALRDRPRARAARDRFERDEEKAMIEFRKHLGWYTKGLPNGRLLRQELFAVTRLADAEILLDRYREEMQEVAA